MSFCFPPRIVTFMSEFLRTRNLISQNRPLVPRENPSFYRGLSLVFAAFRPPIPPEVPRLQQTLLQRRNHRVSPVGNP